MTFYVGQKIVCIGKGPWLQLFTDGTKRSFEPYPIRGVIYTIAAFHPKYADGLILVELEHPLGPNCSWNSSDFRPLVEKKTSISVFKKLLITKKQEVDA